MSQHHLLVFLQNMVPNEQLTVQDVTPIFTYLVNE